MGGISVEEISKIPLPKNGHSKCYQSDFYIWGCGIPNFTRISVLANQPIYCEEERLLLPPKEIADMMCYPKMRVKRVIFHNIRACGLSDVFKNKIESLENV